MSEFNRNYGALLTTSTAIRIPIAKAGSTDYSLSADWTPASGDVKISKNGGTAANVANLPTFVNGRWHFILTAVEMQANVIDVTIIDQTAIKVIEDDAFNILTGMITDITDIIEDTAYTTTVVDAIFEDTDATIPALLAIIDANVDLILVDTNEMQGKLPTNNIMGSSVKTDKDDEIDAILVDTSTDIPILLAALSVQNGTIDTNVDSVLAGQLLLRYQNAVRFDSAAANTSTVVGTDGIVANEISNDVAALSLINSTKLNAIYIIGTMIMTASWKNKARFIGRDLHSIVNFGSQNGHDNYYQDLQVTGTLTGNDDETVFDKCLINAVLDIGGISRGCLYKGITRIADLPSASKDPYTDYGGANFDGTATINFAGSNRIAKFHGWQSELNVTGMDAASSSFELNLAEGAHATLDSSNTAGTIILTGFGRYTDNTGAGCTVVVSGMGLQNWDGYQFSGSPMVADDGSGDTRFTAKALELAPAGGDATLANQITLLAQQILIKAKTDKLPHSIKRGVALNNFPIQMFDTAGDPLPSTVVTSQIMKDGAAYVNMTNTPATFVSDGTYKINLSTSDTAPTTIMMKFTAVGARPTFVAMITEEV